MGKRRLERLRRTAREGTIPTTEGDRPIEIYRADILSAANRFYKTTNPAAEGIPKRPVPPGTRDADLEELEKETGQRMRRRKL